ncbi:hypothetical protein CEXT_808881 [Caerostris extrusa]|uniref:Uncharacterized protein n=1 Tax=Caerostris extrusa TaxID=172846 RepID=A0AAV4WYT0_CAEEX|nr:hypothetical protein CEXT_808881 [Caerostris extrusa]
MLPSSWFSGSYRTGRPILQLDGGVRCNVERKENEETREDGLKQNDGLGCLSLFTSNLHTSLCQILPQDTFCRPSLRPQSKQNFSTQPHDLR